MPSFTNNKFSTLRSNISSNISSFEDTQPRGAGRLEDMNPTGAGRFKDTQPRGAGRLEDMNPTGAGRFEDTQPRGAGKLEDTNPTRAGRLAYPDDSVPLAYPYNPSVGGAHQAPLAYSCPAVPIIGPQFCSPQPVDLQIVRKVLTISDGNFVVKDINGNTILKVKGSFLTLRDRRLLLDAAGSPIITLRKKFMSAHERWEVFKGDSTEPQDLLFNAKKSSILQLSTKLNVFLAHKVNESAPDFTVKGSLFGRSCIIYAGDSSTTIVAQMHKKHTAGSIFLGKDNFRVTVYPGIDSAFIIALIVILDEINGDD